MWYRMVFVVDTLTKHGIVCSTTSFVHGIGPMSHLCPATASVPSLSMAGSDDRRKAIEASYMAGVLTEDEYHSKLEQVGGLQNTAPSTRLVAGVEQRVYDRASWITLSTHETYAKALVHLKAGHHGKVKWADSTGKPGDRRFVCNEHEGCARAFRISGDPIGECTIEEYTQIAHAGLPKLKKRKNSVLTYAQEDVANALLVEGIT